PRRLSDLLGAAHMHRRHPPPENPDQIDHGAGAVDGPADAVGVAEVGLDEAELADLGERLDEIIAARIARGNPHPDSAPEQELDHVTADESAAAEHGDQLFETSDHRAALALAERR